MNFKNQMPERKPGLPLAPLIDIMFLLVAFLLTAVVFQQTEQKIGIALPTADSSITGVRQQGEIIINIDKDGNIFVNDAQVSMLRLREILARISSQFNTPVIIRADEQTYYKNVVAVLDLCRSENVDIWNVFLATIGAEEPQAQ